MRSKCNDIKIQPQNTYIRKTHCIASKVVNFEASVENQQLEKFEEKSSRIVQVELCECRVNNDLTGLDQNVDKTASCQLSFQIDQEQRKFFHIRNSILVEN